MNAKTVLTLIVVGFVVLCGFLIADSGLFKSPPQGSQPLILLQQTDAQDAGAGEEPAAPQQPQLVAAVVPVFGVDQGRAETLIIGAADPNTENADTDFKFQLELTSKGAAIRKATFSNGRNYLGDETGFDDRDYKDPQPLVILSPVNNDVMSMANGKLVFLQHQLQLPLDKLHWNSLDVVKGGDNSQTAGFETIIKDLNTGEFVLKLTKTYKVTPGTYLLDCDITVENLSSERQKVRFDLQGPVGVGREGFRTDMRKAVAGFRNPEGKITSDRLAAKKLRKAKTVEDRRLAKGSDAFLWGAVVNKYFAAILIPLPDEGKEFCDWVADKTGRFYNPDDDSKANSGDETIGMNFKIASTTLAAKQDPGASRTYRFKLYVGPKDKSLFDKNPMYHDLGVLHTIDFLGCCCPASIIKPLAFAILALMKWMYSFVGNYGVVIIILVCLFRLVMHPVTKKSQVSMSKMGTLAPKVEELKKKYTNNKAELNKQMMGLYREHGASPIMSFLPMMVQMPIWIALWSAVYAGIELRGAPFLPFWITDLSVPDALYTFPSAITVPLVRWKILSINLLPLMMGVAFYLQQKLMPSQAAASSSSQMAQQQKMMKIMMPLLFPLMLYNAPSGVNLYIMTSTFAGVLEQFVIRKHIREKQEAESQGLVAATSKTGGKVKKKKPKPFFKNM